MIISSKELLLTLPVLAGLLLLCYAAGFLLSRFCKKRNQTLLFAATSLLETFWRLINGYALLISIYAIFQTQFFTCLLPLPILLYYFEKRRLNHLTLISVPTITSLSNKKIFLFITALMVIYWAFYCSHYISWDNENLNYIEYDTAYYARAGRYLNFSGAENVYMDYLRTMPSSAEPYHYGDLWLIAGIVKLTTLNPILVTQAIVYPFFVIVFIVGIAAWLQQAFPQQTKTPLIFILLLSGFTAGIAIMFPWTFTKLLLVSCILIALLLTLTTRDWVQVIIVGGIGSLLFLTIGPTLAVALSLFLIYLYRSEKRIFRNLTPAFILCAIAAIWLIVLYTHNQTANPVAESLLHFNTKKSLEAFYNAGIQFLKTSPYLLLLAAYLYLHKNTPGNNFSKMKPAFVFGLLLCGTGVAFWGFTAAMTYESVQFFQNIFAPVTWIIIIVAFFTAISSTHKILRASAVMLLVLSFMFNYSSIYNVKKINRAEAGLVKSFLAKHPSGYFANLRSEEEFNTIYERNTVYYQPLIFMGYLFSPYVNMSLNSAYLHNSAATGAEFEEADKKSVQTQPFYLYMKENKENLPIDSLILSFLKKNSIHLLTVSKKAEIPFNIQTTISDSVYLPKEGWKFYYLDY